MKKCIIKMIKKIIVGIINIPLNIFIWSGIIQCFGGTVEFGIIAGYISAAIIIGSLWADIENNRL